MRYILILLVLLIQPVRDIDVAFEGYINDFFEICWEEGIDLSNVEDNAIRVRFGTRSLFKHYEKKHKLKIFGIALGTNNDSAVAILINKDRWIFQDTRHRRLMMYHELMHDVFNVKHVNDRGLMHPVVDQVEGPPGYLLRKELNKIKYEKERKNTEGRR